MTNDELALAMARLCNLAGTSEARSMQRVVDLALGAVPSACGASVSLWRDGDLAGTAASHPELAALVTADHAMRGPLSDALRLRGNVCCPDTLSETRWPRFAAAALRRGVRCAITSVHEADDGVVLLSLYAARPRTLHPEQLPIAALLAASGSAAIANASRYDQARRTVTQLQQAVASRAVVDQAKGMIMHARGCDAVQAFEHLKHISQHEHVKLTEVARRVIAHNAKVRRAD